MVNLSITPEMTKEAVLEAAHKATAVPSLVTIYIIFGISLLLAGWGFKDSDSSWGRFFWIWSATMLLVGVFVLFFIFSPDSVQWIADQWSLMWS